MTTPSSNAEQQALKEQSATTIIETENNTLVSAFGISLEIRAKTSNKALVAVLSKENAKELIRALRFAHNLSNP